MKDQITMPIRVIKLTPKAKKKMLSDPEIIILPCIECGEEYVHETNTLVGQGVFNFFCSVECEDKFAWKQ